MTSECPKNNGIVCGREDKFLLYSFGETLLSINYIHIFIHYFIVFLQFYPLFYTVIFNQRPTLRNLILNIIKAFIIVNKTSFDLTWTDCQKICCKTRMITIKAKQFLNRSFRVGYLPASSTSQTMVKCIEHGSGADGCRFCFFYSGKLKQF